MAFGFALVNGALSLISLYLCFFAPGQAWWHGQGASTPRAFVRVALSSLWTTLVGLALTAADSFHFPLIVLINAAVALLGYLYVGLPRREGLSLRSRSTAAGLLISGVVLISYLPTYDVAFSGSDSTTYVAGGIHLARSHTAWKYDDTGPLLTQSTRKGLFKSVFGYPNKRPYSRILGGMVVENPDDPKVHPSFFPAAIVWAAIFTDIFGARHAGAFCAVYTALGVWAVWVVARRRLAWFGSIVVAVLVAANGAAYYTAKMPLAEPIAWFYAWAALAALDAWEDDGFPADALVAGLMLGALAVIRPEFALFTAAALALRRVFSFSLGSRPLGPSFALGYVAMTIATIAEIRFLRGSYLAPLEEALRAFGWMVWVWRRDTPMELQLLTLLALAAAAVAAFALARRIGFRKSIAIAIAAGFIGAYCASSTPRPLRSLGWLVAFLGYGAPLLALPGLVIAWRRRDEIRGNSFLLVLTVLVGGLLIYNAHVNPALPWAIRRFVPIVIPSVILLAGIACDAAWRRSVLLGFVCWATAAVTILTPASALWGRQHYAGTSQQLHEFAQELPEDGVYLIDVRLAPLLLGVPLWLLHDRDNLPVELSTPFMRRMFDAAVRELRPHRPVYYLRPTPSNYDPLGDYEHEYVTDYTFQLLLPEQTTDRMPTLQETYTTTVSVFRLNARRLPAAAAAP